MSPSWPGFYEGAIWAGEKAAADLSALLKEEEAHTLSPEGAWSLPRSHTLRLVTSVCDGVGVPLTTPELN